MSNRYDRARHRPPDGRPALRRTAAPAPVPAGRGLPPVVPSGTTGGQTVDCWRWDRAHHASACTRWPEERRRGPREELPRGEGSQGTQAKTSHTSSIERTFWHRAHGRPAHLTPSVRYSVLRQLPSGARRSSPQRQCGVWAKLKAIRRKFWRNSFRRLTSGDARQTPAGSHDAMVSNCWDNMLGMLLHTGALTTPMCRPMSVALVRFSAPFGVAASRSSHPPLYDTPLHVIIHQVTQTCRLRIIVGIDHNESYRSSRGHGEAMHRTENSRTGPKNVILRSLKIWKSFNTRRSMRSVDTSRLIKIDIDPTST
jgi:hypothetical protein